MKKPFDYTGMTALVTGASSGLGAIFALQLAERGCDLVLVARSRDKLDVVAEAVRARFGRTVTVIVADLSSASSASELIAEVTSRTIAVDVLVNNAGIGVFEAFLDTPPDRQFAQIDVNVRALVALAHAFAPAMVSAKRGGIINVASMAGFQPLPGAAVYGASKAFVIAFSRALGYELAPHGVRVTAVCPGPVATAFFADKNADDIEKQMDTPERVVVESLRAFERGKPLVVPGRLANRVSAFGVPFLPSSLVLRVSAKIVRRMSRR